MFSSSKYGQQQFSTAENFKESLRNNSYSSRYRKSRVNLQSNTTVIVPHPDIYLPSIAEKAAIKIQRRWRTYMTMRRTYYQQLLDSLLKNNNVRVSLMDKKSKYLKSIEDFNKTSQMIIDGHVRHKLENKKEEIKVLTKQCIKLSFKFQKKMISNQQLVKLSDKCELMKERVMQLNFKKQALNREIFDDECNRRDQFVLREIKEANMKLLKAVEDKNKLRYALHETMKITSNQVQQDSLNQL